MVNCCPEDGARKPDPGASKAPSPMATALTLDGAMFKLLSRTKCVAVVVGFVSGALAAFGAGDARKLLLTAALVSVAAAALHAEGWRQRRRLQRQSLQSDLTSRVAMATKQLQVDPKAFPRLVDDQISHFAPYHRVLRAGATGVKRTAALQQLQLLAEFLEEPAINVAFRRANWKWAADWQHGLVAPREAAVRCATIFPVIAEAAVAAALRKDAAPRRAAESIQHLANWCSDFLVQADEALAAVAKEGCLGPLKAERKAVQQRSWRRCCIFPWPVDDTVDSEHEVEALDGGLGDGIRRLPRRGKDGQTNCWAEPDATVMLVRGPAYISDRCKVLSCPSMFRLVCVDAWLTDDPIVHYAASRRSGNVVRQLRDAGDRRFLFVTNWLVSPFQFVVVWAAPEDSGWLASPEGLLFSRFRVMTDDQRNARLKIIPRVVEAPLMVRQVMPETPTIVGKKLPISYFLGEDYLEASINVVSSDSGRRLMRMLTSSSRWFSTEVYVALEGQQVEELPERVLGGFSIHRLNLSTIPRRD